MSNRIFIFMFLSILEVEILKTFITPKWEKVLSSFGQPKKKCIKIVIQNLYFLNFTGFYKSSL